MMKRIACLVLILFGAFCFAGCHSETKAATEKRKQEKAEKEEVQSEVREDSSLQDPGGAKDVKQETEEQQKQEENSVNDVDKQ
jgi:hypothetical protein